MNAILKATPVLLLMACLTPVANAQDQSTTKGGMRTAVFGPSKVAVQASHSHASLKTSYKKGCQEKYFPLPSPEAGIWPIASSPVSCYEGFGVDQLIRAA